MTLAPIENDAAPLRAQSAQPQANLASIQPRERSEQLSAQPRDGSTQLHDESEGPQIHEHETPVIHAGFDPSFVNRIVGHLLKLDDADSRRKAEGQGNVAVFKHIAHLLAVDIGDVDLESRNPKQVLFRHLANQVSLRTPDQNVMI